VGYYDRWVADRTYYVNFMKLCDLHRLTAVFKIEKCMMLRSAEI